MATLDLQEQEQLDNLKAFWSKWGTLISTVVTLALLAVAGWNGWNWYLRDQGLKASVLYENIEQAVEATEEWNKAESKKQEDFKQVVRDALSERIDRIMDVPKNIRTK